MCSLWSEPWLHVSLWYVKTIHVKNTGARVLHCLHIHIGAHVTYEWMQYKYLQKVLKETTLENQAAGIAPPLVKVVISGKIQNDKRRRHFTS